MTSPSDPRPPSVRFGPVDPDDPLMKREPKVGRPRGIPGKVTREIEYKCDDCGLDQQREQLLVKRVTWMRLGRNGKAVRSRAVKWQCDPCAEIDNDWNKRPVVDAPGMRGAKDAKPSDG